MEKKKVKKESDVQIITNINKEEQLPELLKYDILAGDMYNIITGADLYAWGRCQGTNGSEKQYNFAIRKAGEAIIEAFEGMDGVYISPMLLTLDTDTAFELTSNRMNLYNDNPRTVQCNWVHPEERGYAQMGDALAGVIEMLRQKK